MTLKEQLHHLADRYRLAVIYTFGSRAVEMAGRLEGKAALISALESDADVGVQPEKRNETFRGGAGGIDLGSGRSVRGPEG